MSVSADDLVPGCKLQVLKVMDRESFWREGEVLAKRFAQDGQVEVYVHYTHFNKRLDEWVLAERLNLDTVMMPSAAGSGHHKSSSGGGHSKMPKNQQPSQLSAAGVASPAHADSQSTGRRRGRQSAAATPHVDREPGASRVSSRSRGAAGHMSANATPAHPTSSAVDRKRATFGTGSADEAVAHVTSRSAVSLDADSVFGSGDRMDVDGTGAEARSESPDYQLQQGPIRSKAEEIEALRRGGSMTSRPEEVHRVKNIHSIVLAHHKIETWYFSPYPEEFGLEDTVYICEFCLSFFNSRVRMDRHRAKCNLFHPPGNEIYRHDGISFFEIDGHKQRVYCRNLCLLSKLFLDHKTLYYDVNPFLFYIMTQNDDLGCHIVGYFSKEKESAEGYNVACILTLPNQQRKGYGDRFPAGSQPCLGKLGSPEKPLSDLGLLSYRSFWSDVVLELLYSLHDPFISVEDISSALAMTCDDVVHTLQAMDLLRYVNGGYTIVLGDRHQEMYVKLQNKKRRLIDPSCIQWKPPQFTQAQLRYI